jgi:hypothetical protein
LFFIGLGITEQLEEVAIPEAVRKPVTAEQEEVPGFVVYGSGLDIDELVIGTEGSLQAVAPGMGASFPLIDFPLCIEPARMVVVPGQLTDLAGLRQKIDSGVSDVGVIDPLWRDPAETES